MGNIFINGREVDINKILKEAQANDASKENKKVSRKFMVANLRMSDIANSRISIQPHIGAKREIDIVVSGSETRVNNVSITECGDTVVVTDHPVNRSHNVVQLGDNITIQNSNCFGINIGQSTMGIDRININVGNFSDDMLDFVVQVPLSAEIKISGSSVVIEQGDTLGVTALNLSGRSSATVGRITDCDLSLSGQAKVEIKAVNGDFTGAASGQSQIVVNEIANGDIELHSSGQCNTTIQRGNVDCIMAHLSGMSRLNALCSAKTAKLEASGLCFIFVQSVSGKVRKSKSGMSSIDVG